MDKLYIGVMSGTSLDGIDIALCRIGEQIKLEYHDNYTFDETLKSDILRAINRAITIKEFGEIDDKLGQMYARYINQFIAKFMLNKQEIKAIGLHGQTLWHEPNGGFSIQLGNPNRVAVETGLAVVCDIRRMDMASGGQGAPLAPLFHKFLFGDFDKKMAIINIGGMANVSILEDDIAGYDTGCGNILLDEWCAKYFGVSYDRNGEISKSADIDYKLLESMLGDSYFKQDHPKSTGREHFNIAWVKEHIAKTSSKTSRRSGDNWARKILRTLTELTATTIVNEVKKFDIELLVLCGGGAKNGLLVERICGLFGGEVKLAGEYGVPEDFVEAMMMAYFAFLRTKRYEAKLKTITGASRNHIAGGLYEPN